MTSEIDEFRTSLVAAVQAELERHASAVVREVDKLRDEQRREREEMRSDFTGQIAQLAQAIESSDARCRSAARDPQVAVRVAPERRRAAPDAPPRRRRPPASPAWSPPKRSRSCPTCATRTRRSSRRVEGLDTNLRKFDEQAARMVTYFNDTNQQVEARQEELADQDRDRRGGQGRRPEAVGRGERLGGPQVPERRRPVGHATAERRRGPVQQPAARRRRAGSRKSRARRSPRSTST